MVRVISGGAHGRERGAVACEVVLCIEGADCFFPRGRAPLCRSAMLRGVGELCLVCPAGLLGEGGGAFLIFLWAPLGGRWVHLLHGAIRKSTCGVVGQTVTNGNTIIPLAASQARG